MGYKWHIFTHVWTKKDRDELAATIGEAIWSEVSNPERLRHYGEELKPLAIDFLKTISLAALNSYLQI